MVYKTGYSRQHSTIHVQFSAEPPRGGGSMPRWFAVLIRGGSNEYPQSMFWSKNKKNRYTPTYGTYHTHLYESIVTCLMLKCVEKFAIITTVYHALCFML